MCGTRKNITGVGWFTADADKKLKTQKITEETD
jgi:hypothetical protein